MSSLPCRQLRKEAIVNVPADASSLPCRQLRNSTKSNSDAIYTVHCRVGSLEIIASRILFPDKVHCRVGSLEKQLKHKVPLSVVHCRVGSLEI